MKNRRQSSSWNITNQIALPEQPFPRPKALLAERGKWLVSLLVIKSRASFPAMQRRLGTRRLWVRGVQGQRRGFLGFEAGVKLSFQ